VECKVLQAVSPFVSTQPDGSITLPICWWAARNMIVANVFGSFILLIFLVLGGFILVRGTPSPCFFKKTKRITSPFFLYVVLFIIALFSKKKVGASFFLNLQIK